MKQLIKILVGVTLAAAPMHIVAAQSNTATYTSSGTMMGKHYSSITVNYDTNQLTYNFDDGTQFTTTGGDPVLFMYIVRQLENQ